MPVTFSERPTITRRMGDRQGSGQGPPAGGRLGLHCRCWLSKKGHTLVGREVFGAGDGFAVPGLIAGDLFQTAHLIAVTRFAVAGGRWTPNLAGLERFGFPLAEGAEDVATHVVVR